MLNDLCSYYDCLCKQPNSPLTPKGFSKVGLSYNLQLSKDGTLKAILPHVQKVAMGKKEVERPREEQFPFRNSISGIAAETIDHREKYLFGIDWDKKEKKLVCTKNSLLAFEKCKDKNLAFLEGVSAPIAVAYCRFLTRWNPQEEVDNLLLTAMDKSFGGAKFIISLEYTGETLHENPQVLEKWQQGLATQVQPKGSVVGQCAISGEVAPLARIHNNLKGIQGGLATGANLVCYKTSAFESYGKSESYNSAISQEMMEKYTEAFNFLSTSPDHKQVLDGTTLLFWAMTTGDETPMIQSFRRRILSEEDRNQQKIKSVESGVEAALEDLSEGSVADYDAIAKMEHVEFYILGIRPNTSRLAIKLFHHNNFGTMMQHGEAHQRDMQLHPEDKPLSLWQMQTALKSPKSSGDLPPDLGVKLLESVLNGTPYPRFMLDTAVYRAKTDQDDKTFLAVNATRVRIIKGCLTRLGKLEREEFSMLNEASKDPKDTAYLCGSLFAVLEQIQRTALGNINATIKDKFFSSACSTPYLVFPRLLKLAQSHLNKMSDGSAIYYDKMLQEIMGKMGNAFPRTLSMEKQGMFILGYYQQKEKLFTKKEEK